MHWGRVVADRRNAQVAPASMSTFHGLGDGTEPGSAAASGHERSVRSALRHARPEDRLLLLCARSHLSSTTLAEVSTLLEQDLNWEHLLRMADINEITPLLHHGLKRIRRELIPAAILRRLEASFYDNVGRNLLLTSTLVQLLDVFATHGISALPLKGPILAATAYGDLSLRQFCDLDILVRRHDLERAESLIARGGYQRRLELAGLRDNAYRHSETAYDFVREDGRVTVELHWELMPRYFSTPLRLEQALQRVEPVTLLGSVVPGLAAEDLLLYLCVHGTKHRWERLKWICDVAELLHTRRDVNWTVVVERAVQMGVSRMLALGLALASELLDAPLPDRVRSRVRSDPTANALALDAFGRLFATTPGPLARDNLYYMRAMQSPWRRLRYALHVLAVPTIEDLEAVALPGLFALLYYPLRPARLFGRALRVGRRTPRC